MTLKPLAGGWINPDQVLTVTDNGNNTYTVLMSDGVTKYPNVIPSRLYVIFPELIPPPPTIVPPSSGGTPPGGSATQEEGS